MKRTHFIYFLTALLLPLTVTAKKDKKEAATPTKSKYEKIISEAGEHKAEGDFISLYRVKDKVYVDMPIKYMGRSVLIGSCVAESSNSQVAMTGYKPNDPIHVSFELNDSTVFLRRMLTNMQVDSTYNLAMQRSCQNPFLEKYRVEGFNADSTRVIFDMTSLFTGNNEELSPIAKNVSILKVKTTPKKELTQLTTIRAFHNNASISTFMSYDYSLTLLGTEVTKGVVSCKVTRTLLLLPEERMKQRISDARLGIFLTEKTVISPKRDGMSFQSVCHRWRLEPKDTSAWMRGELVEVKKPIIWYVDDAFPKGWIEPLKRSVTIWNKAFEKMGFKNVMVARSFPTKEEDPNFDPNNLAYSCIRYVPIPVANSQGPSWVDPRSGEIINASVMVYNDVIRLINNWRFIQTAQCDTAARHSKMPKQVMDDALTYVFSHEIGHTLGLMHNMAASNAFPVDSLRSATFTQRYGDTPSIMDYARWNYVAQPGDKGVRLSPPDVGIYDEFAIKWLYSPVPGNHTVTEEQKILEKWVDEKANDPRFRYGRQQVYARYDPSSLEEDLGDDAIKAGEYGIKNLKYILSNLNTWITDDSSYVHRRELYKEMVSQFTGYLTNVLENVGGIRLTQVKEGGKTSEHESVAADLQHKSLLWVIDQLRNCDWLNATDLTRHFPMAMSTSVTLTNTIGKQLMDRSNNVLLSAQMSNTNTQHPTPNNEKPYTQADYFNDLYTTIWQPTIQGKALNAGDKLLQRAIVATCAGKVSAISGSKKALTGTTVDDIVTYHLDPTGFIDEHQAELRSLDERYGTGFVASLLPPTDGCGCPLEPAAQNNQFSTISSNLQTTLNSQLSSLNSFGEEADYGFQHDVNTDIIDESQALYFNMLQKVQTLIKSRLASASANDKMHYQSLLLQLQGAIEK